METTYDFSKRKTELEERIRSLEDERAALVAAIPMLKEKLETLSLEDKVDTLENEVKGLRSERFMLEEEIARYSYHESEPQASPEPQETSYQAAEVHSTEQSKVESAGDQVAS